MSRQTVRTALLALGLLGLLMCAVSGLARVAGIYLIGGVGVQSVLVAGIALMVAAVFGKQFFVDD